MASLSGRLFRLAGPRIPGALARPFAGPAAVFFHGVEPREADARIRENHHSREEFARIARALSREFDVMPLAMLPEVLARPRRYARSLFLMSDDGYANTLSVAADVLEEFRLPWTLFVSTDHIDTGEANPMLIARLFFGEAPEGVYRIPHIEPTVVLAGPLQRAAEKARVMPALRALDGARAREAIGAMGKAIANPVVQFPGERFLLWDEVRALNRRGVEIGAHARWHWPMNGAQSAQTLRNQAAHAKARIEQEIGPCRYFAYPFGQPDDVSKDAWQAVRDAGFSHAFTTLSGTLDASLNPWLLPRYGLAHAERNAASLVALLRAGNTRLRRWQQELAA